MREVHTTTVRVSERGLITIPAAARRKLGIKPKSRVVLEVRENEIAIRPVKSILDVAGTLREYAKGKTTDWDTIREETMKAVAREVMDDNDD
ncbi:MAG: AbrB/MazE/SpoVT family DNA-binding domain-containing protein [Armatimonadetes bacterium]|nr:AbrB/MazE/SpoVT family DNA-binding domain-containing protein [Armatimonadota bacterium]